MLDLRPRLRHKLFVIIFIHKYLGAISTDVIIKKDPLSR